VLILLTCFLHNQSEHFQRNSLQSDQVQANPSLLLERFEIGELDDDDEIDAGDIQQHASNSPRVANHQQNGMSSNAPAGTEEGDMNTTTLQILRQHLNGWDVGTSAQEMKHQILLGLRVGFCGAVSTWSSWNSAMTGLLQAGKIAEAFVGYALGIQLGVVCYRCE
jgi:hypothetical protein